MTLLDCYDKYQGTPVLVPGGGAGNDGQCEQWADAVLHEVYGLDYTYTPNAKDWWYDFDSFPQLADNFDKITDGSIKAGDFVVYDPVSSNDAPGHIDVAAQDGTRTAYVGYDSNWGGTLFYVDGYPVLHTVTHADQYNQYILGALRPKGENMNPTPAQAGAAYAALATNPDMSPGDISQPDLDAAIQTPWAEWIPNFFPGVQTLRDDVKLLTTDRDTDLYPKINAVTGALGLPTSATADDMTKAIAALKSEPTPAPSPEPMPDPISEPLPSPVPSPAPAGDSIWSHIVAIFKALAGVK